VAVIPAMLSFGLVVFAVKEPPSPRPSPGTVPGSAFLGTVPGLRLSFRELGPAFWSVTAVGSVLTLARFSEAFLILRAENVGVAIALTPLVLVGMNVVYALVAYPAGRLADRIAPQRMLVAGVGVLVAADLVLAMTSGIAGLAVGVLLWGLHMGLTQGLLAAMVAHAAPAELRGTAFGVFNLASGVAMLLASAIAGALWHYVGPAATFWAGAALALAAAILTRSALR
jgi:MFS family permease